MTILFIGHYHREYPRNACILKGLRQNGVVVHEICVGLSRPKRLLNLWRAWRHFRTHHELPDILMVPMVDLETFPFVWVLAWKYHLPIVYDAFVSRYAAWTIEKGRPATSLKARSLYALEGFALRQADLLLSDTRAHAELFIRLYHLSVGRFHAIYISLDDEVYQPVPPSENIPFLVQFLGFFHPLTGADTIIRAAALLSQEPDIVIEMIGMKDDAESQAIRNLANALQVSNVTFMEAIPYAEQPAHIARANVCLGVFGDTDQAARVFPNKGYQALAMAKPLITRDCPALHEILEPGLHVETVPPANPQALAEAILKLKHSPEYCAQLARRGYERFQTHLTPSLLGAQFVERLKRLNRDALPRSSAAAKGDA